MATMTPLLTVAQLAVWAQQEIDDDDEFALVVIEAASLVVAEKAAHLDWIEIIAPAVALTPAPSRARLIATQLAKRTFLNPHAVLWEGNIGPIGGDKLVEDFSRTLELTLVESAELEAMQPAGAATGNGLWVQPVETGRVAVGSTTIYLPDGSNLDSIIPMGTQGVDDWAYTPLEIV